jgi:hypothetical protein
MSGGCTVKTVLLMALLLLLGGCFDNEKTPQPPAPKALVKVEQCVQKACPNITSECPNVKLECPAPAPCPVCEKPKPPVKKLIFKDFGKVVIGEVEDVYLPIHGLELEGRVDTGATTTSIHALDIVAFERDGNKWVRFNLIDEKGEKHMIKRPLERTIRVKRHESEGQERYVVKMRVNLSSLSKFIDVSLVDRSNYSYPVLIGRNFLGGSALVDVSKQHTQKPTRAHK